MAIQLMSNKVIFNLFCFLYPLSLYSQRVFYCDSVFVKSDSAFVGDCYYYYDLYENALDSVENALGDSSFNLKIKVIAACQDGQSLNGPVRGYLKNRLFFEVPYKNGCANGLFVRYFGIADTASYIMLKNGKRHGQSVFYYNDAKEHLYCQEFRDGKEDGPFMIYDSGRLDFFCNYKNGQKHGVEYQLYDTGRLWHSLRYENGKVKDGRYDGFDYDGNIEEELYFKDGILIQKICYDGEGNVIKCIR